MKGIGNAHQGIISVLVLMLVSITRRLPAARRLSSGTTMLALAGIVLLVAAGSASADTEINSATFNGGNYDADTANERYYLTADLICDASNKAGIIIGASGVTIDGAGYKITGSTTSANCEWADEVTPCTVSGIYNVGHDDVVIKNLEIEKFCTGIALKGGAAPATRICNNTIDNCSIHGNGFNTMSGGSDMTTHGVHACWVNGTADVPALTIVNNNISNNEGTGEACGDGGNGIFIYAGYPQTRHEYCNISYNELHDNAKAGFWTKYMLSKCSITHNNASGNGHGTGISDDVRGGIILRCKM